MLSTEVRRYVMVIQDARGYVEAGTLEPGPPDGPTPPVVHSVVLTAAHEALVEQLRDELVSQTALAEAWGKDVERLREAADAAFAWIESVEQWTGPGVPEDREDVMGALTKALGGER